MITAIIKFQAEGFHKWEKANGNRDYLAKLHRHMFHVEVRLELFHKDREVEFHDLKDYCIDMFGKGNFDSKSCEDLACDLALKVRKKYTGRDITVVVLEDGEVGAKYAI